MQACNEEIPLSVLYTSPCLHALLSVPVFARVERGHTCVRRTRDARAGRLLRCLTRTNCASETPQQTAVLGRAVGLRRGPLLPAGLHATHPVFAPWAAL